MRGPSGFAAGEREKHCRPCSCGGATHMPPYELYACMQQCFVPDCVKAAVEP